MENGEINLPPETSDNSEQNFRQKAMTRLKGLRESLGDERVEHWLGLLSDEDPGARSMATTSAWTMMDVHEMHQGKMLANRLILGNTIDDENTKRTA